MKRKYTEVCIYMHKTSGDIDATVAKNYILWTIIATMAGLFFKVQMKYKSRVLSTSCIDQETLQCFMRVETSWNDQIHISRTQTLHNCIGELTALLREFGKSY